MDFTSKIYNDRPGRIIPYMTDDDLYKFTMQQLVLHRFPSARAAFRFKCRNVAGLGQYADEIRREIELLGELTFEKWELEYLSDLPFITEDYVAFLEDFRLKPRYVHVVEKHGEIDIFIEGPWLQTILFEVKILKIVEEVYMRNNYPDMDFSYGREQLKQKIDQILCALTEGLPFKFADFGTRRTCFGIWHEEVVATLSHELGADCFVGTSNVMLAALYNIRSIGTMAHEIFQAGQRLGVPLVDSQKFVLQEWANEYRGDLGIALSDTLGIDKFLKDFDLYFAKLFDGLRHDSGDPIEWAEKIIQHYRHLGVDPKNKSLVFSDGLNIPKAIDILRQLYGRARISFGIGTNLTNDIGVTPLQVVIKMIECNGGSVAKVSDSPGKTMCEDIDFLMYLRKVVKDDIS